MNGPDSSLEETMFSPDENKLSFQQEEELKRQNILDQYNFNTVKQVVQDNQSRPANITNFNILGTDGKYRNSFLKAQLDPIISQLNDNGRSLTFSQLLKRIDDVNFNLLKTDSISDIGCQIGIPENQPYNYLNPDLLNVFVNLQVVPVKKFFLKIGTNVGNGEGDGYVKLQWKNIFGGGESLDLDTNLSSNEFKMKSSKSQYVVNYSSPIFNSANYKFNSVLFHSMRTIDYTSYHNQSIEGLTLKFSTNNLPLENKLNHEISIENLLRSISLKTPPSSVASSIRNNSLMTNFFLFNAGYNYKSSITYSIFKDTRDKQYIFEKGYYLRLSNELSLFTKNKFVKTSFDYSKGYRINKSLIFNLNFKTGLTHPLYNDLVHPMDKFQLGGANDMKGWLISGMGPKQMNMSLGGNYFHAIGLNLFSNIPYYSDSNFKFHLFTNIGKLTNNFSILNANAASNVFKNNCISTGFGISFAHPMAAFELNWVVPVTANANDSIRRGLQWGIGISFL